MTQFVVLEGYLDKSKGQTVSLLLLDGTTLTFPSKGISKAAAIDTSAEPITRVFLEPDTDVTLTFKAKELMGRGGSPIGAQSIAKWLDDGGTISKSRDDGLQIATTFKYYDDGGTVPKSYDDV